MIQPDGFSYQFSLDEIRTLIRFLRRHEEHLDPALENFMGAVEKYIYNTMTIDEAETFFHEDIR